MNSFADEVKAANERLGAIEPAAAAWRRALEAWKLAAERIDPASERFVLVKSGAERLGLDAAEKKARQELFEAEDALDRALLRARDGLGYASQARRSRGGE